MADFLLVHDIGQGSWSWGRVWGYLTAPDRHPPALYAKSRVGQVISMDLPRHVVRPMEEDMPALTFDDFVSSVVDEVKARDLRDVILVGHGLSAPIVLQAASILEVPPRRVVLFAGAIPDAGRATVDVLPTLKRLSFRMLARMKRVSKYEFRLPKMVLTGLYCNGMDPFDMIQIVGRYTPLPSQLVRTKIRLSDISSICPITYVPLWRDKLMPSQLQSRMAERLVGVEVENQIDSCHQVMMERPKQVADILVKYA